MRYTAKARMLSFDFLPDDVVYQLPPAQALLLAGMVTRADNLGRLPGDPPVLLAYLFFPKPPRKDIGEHEVEELLTTLASAAPPVVLWYQVERSRYIQFRRWQVHQSGLRERNLKSTLPGPDAPGAEPVLTHGQPSLFAPPPPPVVDLNPHTGVSVESLVRQVAGEHAMARTLGDFNGDRVWEWVRANGGEDVPMMPGREWLKFARWLWNTGTTNMDTVVALMDECLRLQPRQPYAYFHHEHGTRDIKAMQARVSVGAAQHEATKKEDAKRWPRAET